MAMTASEPIIALDADLVAKLVGLPKSTLFAWEHQGVFTPSFVDPAVRVPLRRIYSFRDVVSLRALARIRRGLGVPLAEIRKAGSYLSQYYESPWSHLTFGVVNKKLVFKDPETGKWMGHSGQGVLELNLAGVPQEVERDVRAVFKRSSADHGVITRRRNVQHNQPTIAGTRIPTSTIWVYHEDGYTSAQILEQFPQLTEEDVNAAIEFEAERRSAA